MKSLVALAAAALVIGMSPAEAASFDCMEYDGMNAAERRICKSSSLGAFDERLDSWYRRALVRAKYFDQTAELRSDQRAWIASRNSCGASYFCIRRHYVKRINQLKNYVEHV